MSFRAVVGREEWGGGDAGQGRPVSYCTSSNYTQVMSFTRVSTRTSTFIVPFIVYVRRVCSSPHCVTLYIYACSFPFLILWAGLRLRVRHHHCCGRPEKHSNAASIAIVAFSRFR